MYMESMCIGSPFVVHLLSIHSCFHNKSKGLYNYLSNFLVHAGFENLINIAIQIRSI